MNNPQDYIWIRRWGQMLHSHEYYIRDEQERAARENAPVTAIYRGQDGSWHTAEQITNPETRFMLTQRFGSVPEAK